MLSVLTYPLYSNVTPLYPFSPSGKTRRETVESVSLTLIQGDRLASWCGELR